MCCQPDKLHYIKSDYLELTQEVTYIAQSFDHYANLNLISQSYPNPM